MGRVITSFVARRAAQLAPATVAAPDSALAVSREVTDRFRGSRYESTRDLDLAEIAKLVRADLRDLVKRGFKCAVRISRFSGGQSLKVEVKSTPQGFRVLNQERLAWEREHPHQHCTHLAIFSDEAIEVQRKIESLVASYNRDNSDTQTDYFDVRFYSSVSFAFELTRAERGSM